MRKIIWAALFSIMFLFPQFISGQNVDTAKKINICKAYLDGGPGITNESEEEVGAGLHLILLNNWGASVSYNVYFPEAVDLPANYYSGLCLFGNCKPNDNLTSTSLRVMREFPTKTKLIRFGIEGGFSFVGYKKAHFSYNSNQGFFDSNYIVTYSQKYSGGVSLRLKAEFPFTRFAGLELAMVSNINPYLSYVGMELTMTLGVVRDRIKPKKN
jgi:hypothetical protein